MNKLKLSLLFVLLVLSLFIIIQQVSADGFLHVSDQNNVWRLVPEDQQLAAINYEKGIENLLISIGIPKNLTGERVVWIFPVPSSPDKVKIDILKGYPRIYANSVYEDYADVLGTVTSTMIVYSTFPLCILFWWSFDYLSFRAPTNSGSDVIVYEKIEKMGLTTELITTKDQASLSHYLQSKGLNLPPDSQSILEEYVGKNYSFVVSYINNLTQFEQEIHAEAVPEETPRENRTIPLGVFVKFPTKKIYFPLKLTSIYGNRSIPISIDVMGYVTPKLYPGIKSAQVTYYTGWWYLSDELKMLFNGKEKTDNLKYTTIDLNVPSKNFTDDLWIKNSTPVSISIKISLIRTSQVWGIILFILLSMLSSLFAGMISFRKNPLPKKKLLLFGLWNCLTFIGFLTAVLFMKTKPLDKRLREQVKSQGLSIIILDKRKAKYLFLFYLFFIALTFFTGWALFHY